MKTSFREKAGDRVVVEEGSLVVVELLQPLRVLLLDELPEERRLPGLRGADLRLRNV